MVLTKAEAQANLQKAKQDLQSKKGQIRSARKRSFFAGVTVNDQFNVGIGGIKEFTRAGKKKRNLALNDLGFFSSQLPQLKDQIGLRQAELDAFDIETL